MQESIYQRLFSINNPIASGFVSDKILCERNIYIHTHTHTHTEVENEFTQVNLANTFLFKSTKSKAKERDARH